ncbi:hypothetical protein ACLS0R_03650 [Comamonas jiangduensis]|uniref:hypothetical protein n=1 Tax=Comamonas jiangduensis TaxID=1194168 RepID=UPI003BF7DF7E
MNAFSDAHSQDLLNRINDVLAQPDAHALSELRKSAALFRRVVLHHRHLESLNTHIDMTKAAIHMDKTD